jgi:uncharacterized protein (DUF433 family)
MEAGKSYYIISDPEILGGTPAFRGTRVPFSFLMEYIEKGYTIEQFLEDYPSVSLELATKALEEASLVVENYAYAHSS